MIIGKGNFYHVYVLTEFTIITTYKNNCKFKNLNFANHLTTFSLYYAFKVENITIMEKIADNAYI